jgi:PTS system glucitol/sorbitol-specific IIB component
MVSGRMTFCCLLTYLVITPTEAKHKLVYIVGGGVRPPVVDRIAELSGAEALTGWHDVDSRDSLARVDSAP